MLVDQVASRGRFSLARIRFETFASLCFPPWYEDDLVGRYRTFSTMLFAALFLAAHSNPGLMVRYYGERTYARFYALETIARVPYFGYLCVLHLYETLGQWRQVIPFFSSGLVVYLVAVASFGLQRDSPIGYSCMVFMIFLRFVFVPSYDRSSKFWFLTRRCD